MHENDPAPKLMVKNRKIVREGGLAILEHVSLAENVATSEMDDESVTREVLLDWS
jgi:hypothetical protein